MKLFLFLAFSSLMLLEAYRFSDETDRQALMEFKSQVSKGGKVVLSSWNNSLHVCNWEEVSCGRRHKRVTRLNLGALQLGGMISPSIGNLSFLVSLNLSRNSFGGIIPKQVGNLFRLQSLDLRVNNLEGGIPIPLFNCSRLEKLYLYSNPLGGGVPSELGSLTKLVILSLYQNDLRGTLPASLGNLTSLMEVSFADNFLGGGIPIPLFNCSRLEKLFLSSNPLGGGVPSELGSLTKLVILSLSKNNLKGTLPASLGNLTSLKTVDFSYNNLEGEIPNDIGRLTHIVFLNLNFNKFSGDFPLSIYNLSSLEILSVISCGFSGSLKPYFGNLLPNIQEINMGDNFFTGAIPTTLANISNFQRLNMALNNLSGSITPSFGKMSKLQFLLLWDNNLGSGSLVDLDFLRALTNCTQLQVLDVSGNRLAGELPTSIVNLSTNLTILSLGDNSISGRIPREIGNLISLQTIDLSKNLLTGPLPNSIGKLLGLGAIYLDSNKLSGGIPSSVGNLTQLVRLYLSNNSFEGAIPPSLGNCSHLLDLQIEQNRLTGIIPPEIMQISSLISLCIGNNSLTGSLPEDIGKLKNLEDLQIQNNRLNGIIPPEILQFLSLNTLSVQNNFLTGSLPEDIGQLKNLVHLSVVDNKLSGKLPQALGACLTMEELSLRGNSFDGVIPDIRGLVGLKRFDLSSNNLSGRIPGYIANFSKLEYLNLSFNNFEGRVPTTGIFLNSTIVLLSGNKDLCGGIKELKLRPCTVQSPKETKHSSTLKKVVIGVSVGIAFFLVLFIVFLCWFRKRKNYQANNPAAPSILEVFHEKISYGDLRTATDGFSSSNMVGSGSFGTVFKALLPTENKVVAVKVLNLQRHGAMRSFMAECESLKDIKHRNLVKLLTACASIDFQGNQFRALIYEFMANGSLDMWLHPEDVEETSRPSRTLTLLERLNIAIDVASVLDYLHVHCHEPIAHCDLKPSNILLDDDLTAHVSDFGLARLLFKFDQEFFNQLSSTGVRGTIGYAAPEYGVGGQPSIHGDVYSFGVLLLEMFTGKRPTNELFGGNFNLHSYTKAALPERVLEIADESIIHNVLRVGFHVAQCLTMVLELGLRCCEESPTKRLGTSEAAKELISIRERFFKTRRTTRR